VKILLLLFSLALGAVVQSMLGSWETLGMAKIPMMLSITIYYALNRSQGMMLAAGGLGGFIKDALGMTELGMSSLIFCSIGLFLNRFQGDLFGNRLITMVWLGVISSVIVVTVTSGVLISLQLTDITFISFLARLAGTCILAAICVPLVGKVLEYFDYMLGVGVGSSSHAEDLF